MDHRDRRHRPHDAARRTRRRTDVVTRRTRILLETSTHLDPGRIGYLVVATGEVVNLGEGAFPRWSPDGHRIAYVVGSAGNLDVFIMDADGGNHLNVTNGAGVSTLPLGLGNDNQLFFVSRPPAG